MTKPDIRAVLEHYGWDGRATGYGAWRNTRCPFHGDRNPSARVNEDEQVFHCFVCGVSGDAYECIKTHEGVTFDEAKRRVESITGCSGTQVSGRPTGTRLASSKLPAWTRDKSRGSRRLSSRGGRREHS